MTILISEQGQSVEPWPSLRAFRVEWNQQKKPPSHERKKVHMKKQSCSYSRLRCLGLHSLVCIGMASLAVSSSSKHQWVSQPNINIIMICMHYHETSPPSHPMIPIASTLPHLVSLVAPCSSLYFTPCLHH